MLSDKYSADASRAIHYSDKYDHNRSVMSRLWSLGCFGVILVELGLWWTDPGFLRVAVIATGLWTVAAAIKYWMIERSRSHMNIAAALAWAEPVVARLEPEHGVSKMRAERAMRSWRWAKRSMPRKP